MKLNSFLILKKFTLNILNLKKSLVLNGHHVYVFNCVAFPLCNLVLHLCEVCLVLCYTLQMTLWNQDYRQVEHDQKCKMIMWSVALTGQHMVEDVSLSLG